MKSYDINKNLKNKIEDIIKEIDHPNRILFILKNLGPQRFSDLEGNCDMSKSTLSKYLKINLQNNNIEKKILDKLPHYIITEKGIEKLNEDLSDVIDNTFYINEINESILKSSNLIEFYEEIGIDESILFQILSIISKIGQKFFSLNQNRELFLALFYMFLNSVLTPEYKFEINEFCKHYNVKKLKIDFYVDKIMSNKFGFLMFTRDDDVFFFHEEDILGVTTLRLIKDQLIEEIIHINVKGYRLFYDLDKYSEEIAEQLLEMKLLWDEIREPFEMLIQKILIKKAVDMGISKTFLMDMVVQSAKLSKSVQGVNSLVNIINGSDSYEDLNIVSISESREQGLEEFVNKIKGFCPNCGKSILKQDISNLCSRCNNSFKVDNLIKSVDKANEISMKYKEQILKQEELVPCPNENCEAKVSINWDECPICHTKIN